MGSLMIYEITMKGHEDVENKKKSGIAFKASSNEEERETPVSMKAMPCLVEISKSTSRKTIMEEEDLSRKSTTKITRKSLLFAMSAKILDI